MRCQLIHRDRLRHRLGVLAIHPVRDDRINDRVLLSARREGVQPLRPGLELACGGVKQADQPAVGFVVLLEHGKNAAIANQYDFPSALISPGAPYHNSDVF